MFNVQMCFWHTLNFLDGDPCEQFDTLPLDKCTHQSLSKAGDVVLY
jgi:hypothetical protein